MEQYSGTVLAIRLILTTGIGYVTYLFITRVYLVAIYQLLKIIGVLVLFGCENILYQACGGTFFGVKSEESKESKESLYITVTITKIQVSS